jgi:hypothetical protein
MVIREHGMDSVSAVKLAVLETDGAISIVPKTSRVVRTRKHVRQLRRRWLHSGGPSSRLIPNSADSEPGEACKPFVHDQSRVD